MNFEIEPVEQPKVLIPEIDDSLTVTALKNPFSFERVDFEVTAGQTVAEILRGLNVYPPAGCNALVFINDSLLSRDAWEYVRPKPGHQVIVRVVPTGGGRGAKGILGIVLRIVITVVAYIFGQYYAPVLWGAAAGTASTAANVAGAIGASLGNFVGGLIASAIAPPLKPKVPGSLGFEGSPTLNGVGNAINRYGPVPRIFGRYRFYPPVTTEVKVLCSSHSLKLKAKFTRRLSMTMGVSSSRMKSPGCPPSLPNPERRAA